MNKVAVVGFGFMGMTHSLNIFKNQDLELVAIIDKDIESIEQKLKQPEGNFSTGEIDPDYIQVSSHDENKRLELDQEDGFYNEIDYFKKCLVTNSKPDFCTPESALDSIELCYQHLT